MKKIKEFFREMSAELKRVVWPSFDKVMDNTRIVLVSTFLLAIFFGLVNYVLFQAVELLF